MTSRSTTAQQLSSQIAVRSGYLRATNLEQHTTSLGHYIPTGRALDIVGRLSRAILGDTPGHAWSLTGPYGAGKSSFAVFLRALLGPAGPTRDEADQRLRETSEAAAELLFRARQEAGGAARGFVLAMTTCQPEPVTESLLRGLDRGVHEYWPSRQPGEVVKALARARSTRTPRDVASAAASVSGHAPVLLLLDEFGKTLEHFATSSSTDAHADLFVLQELAERATGDRARILLLTLQHLAFDDYVRSASVAQRREWGKVAGRFEDVPFVETAEQSLRLVAGALDTEALSKPLASKRRRWSLAAHAELTRVGLEGRLPGGPETLERCYPMHPVALLALPELCARLGQHGRTLFTFLASTEQHTLRSFLDHVSIPSGRNNVLPALSLPEMGTRSCDR